MVVLVMYKNLF